MKNFYDLGFSQPQINQINQIESTGYEISKSKYLDCFVSVETLRQLKEIFNTKDYTNRQKGIITKFYIKNNLDVSFLIDNGFDLTCKINLALQAKEDDIDISILYNTDYDYVQMKLIYKYLKKGYNIIPYVDKGYTETKIKNCIELKEKGLDAEVVYDDYAEGKANIIIYHMLHHNINPLECIDTSYSLAEIKSTINLLLNGMDASKIKGLKLSQSQATCLLQAKNENIDLIPYIDRKKNKRVLKVIIECLKNDIDPDLVLKYKNDAKIEIAYLILLEKEDASFLSDEYKPGCLTVIKNLLKKGYKKSQIAEFLNPELNVLQVQTASKLFLDNNECYKYYLSCPVDDYVVYLLKRVNVVILKEYLHPAITTEEISSINYLLNHGYKIEKTP